MKHNVGDKVRVHSLEWFEHSCRHPGSCYIIIGEPACFDEYMRKFCGKIVTIETAFHEHYTIKEDSDNDVTWWFYDWMFEEEDMKEETNWEHYQKEIEKIVTNHDCRYCPAELDCFRDKENCRESFHNWANSKYISVEPVKPKPVYRAWTKDTFPLHIGTEVKEKGSDFVEGVSNYCKSTEKIWISNDPTGMTFSEFFAKYEMADGLPCGELIKRK